MEEHKRKNFQSETNEEFPEFVTLGKDECAEILFRLKLAFGLSVDTDGLAVLVELSRRQSFCFGLNADSEDFDLEETFRALKIDADERVLINWYRFDRIDRIDRADLLRFFSDIWYPSSDDIEVFDASLRWILSIRHDGCVFFAVLH